MVCWHSAGKELQCGSLNNMIRFCFNPVLYDFPLQSPNPMLSQCGDCKDHATQQKCFHYDHAKSYSSASSSGLTVQIQSNRIVHVEFVNTNHDAGNCHRTTEWHYFRVMRGIGELKSGYMKSVYIFHIQTRHISNYCAWYLYYIIFRWYTEITYSAIVEWLYFLETAMAKTAPDGSWTTKVHYLLLPARL
jgi:hypothetical protein